MFLIKDEIKTLFVFLLILFVLNGCDSGWSISGWEIK